VSTAEADAFAKAHRLAYLETSAADGTNIEDAFLTATSDLLRKIRIGEITSMQLPAQQHEKEGCCA
jgi:late competence protein required for DNA uptake (superfamily II DNA/RNA helicase)